jgi:hypothetical protein
LWPKNDCGLRFRPSLACLWAHHAVRVSLDLPPWTFEPISTAYQSVCMCGPPIFATQRLDRHVPTATNIHTATEESFYVPSVLYEGRVCESVCCSATTRWTLSNSNKELLNEVVFYAVRNVSTESRQLVLPRTSCFWFYLTTQSVPQATQSRLTSGWWIGKDLKGDGHDWRLLIPVSG